MSDLKIRAGYHGHGFPQPVERDALVSPGRKISENREVTISACYTKQCRVSDFSLKENARSVLRHSTDFARGVYTSAKEGIQGVWQLGTGTLSLMRDALFAPEQFQESIDDISRATRSVIRNPELLWNGITQPYSEAWKEGRPCEAVGRGVFEIGTLFVGLKGLDKVVKGERARIALGLADDALYLERGRIGEKVSKWVKKVNGRYPINYEYAGKIYRLEGPLARKYPEGVRFKRSGFPDFSPYAIEEVRVNGLTGGRYDFTLANQKANLRSLPKDYTWHHVEDGKTMQLVPRDLHSSVRHTGGSAILSRQRT